MICLPSNLVIDSIANCCFVHFKDVNHDVSSPPHYYLVLPSTGTHGNLYLVSIVTSKFEKRLHYYNRTPTPKAAQSLVRLEKGCLSFITNESAIDCNKTERLTKKDFIRKIDKNIGVKIPERSVDPNLIKSVVTAIQNSPLIAPSLKVDLNSL